MNTYVVEHDYKFIVTKDPLAILNESRNFQLEDTSEFDKKMKKYFSKKRNYPFVVSLNHEIIFFQTEKIREIGVCSWVSPLHIKRI
ncbi:MAG: competence protein ComK, partial [Turicibacter sp.]